MKLLLIIPLIPILAAIGAVYDTRTIEGCKASVSFCEENLDY